MKPYHGGTLLSIDGQPTGITPSQCLDYVFSLPVTTAVPGPKNLAEWKATLRYAQASAEEKDYHPALDALYDRLAGHCVYCHHCLPCPEGIEVGWLLWCADMARGAGAAEYQEFYDSYPVKASACVDCGICVERCPFDVDVMARLREAVALFESA
jgi:predicted aldo/keto reductase-like oxidoreductase